MSLQTGDGLTYVEYINAPHNNMDDQKTYYITVNSTPVNFVNVKGLDQTPESDHQYNIKEDVLHSSLQQQDLSSPHTTTIYSSTRPQQSSYYDESLAMSSSFTLTPDKDEVYGTPERRTGGGFLHGLRDSGKRGRPRADVINNLIVEGAQSGSNIKCKICSRVFPREKSLQAHLRTHTGEKPYNCDYPGCTRAFTQSGQLKTHQRLHAGEKPFLCSHPGCNQRYTHANRQCPDHPYAKPQRTAEIILQPNISSSEDKGQVMAWLEKYKREKEEKTPGKFNSCPEYTNEPNTPTTSSEQKKSRSKRGLAVEMDQCVDQENQENGPRTPTTGRTSAAKQTLNAALQRAGERLENNQGIHRLLAAPNPNIKNEDYLSSLPLMSSVRGQFISPIKRHPLVDHQSPLKGIRRTLGDITPTKNCRPSDQLIHADLDLPFNFGLPTSPALSTSEMILRTPIPAEKYLASPTIQGSPALKLKKRFQERFQEEKLIGEQRVGEELAKPILWQEDDEFTTPVKQRYLLPLSSPPPQRREFSSPLSAYGEFSSSSPSRGDTASPTLLVAAALVELQDTSREDIPLNLTKHK